LRLYPHPFAFDGATVTMHLDRLHLWMWHSEDDYYRMKAKWQENELYCLYPFGGWEKVATLVDGCFQYPKANEPPVLYCPIREGSLRPDHPLRKSRPLHDYTIAPNGTRQSNDG
jgi:hypothetical protein